MRSIFGLGLAAGMLMACATPVQAAYIYGPGAHYEGAEGNSNNGVFLHTDFRTQWVFNPSVFGDRPMTIHGFSLRFDNSVINFVDDEPMILKLNRAFSVRLATIEGMASQTFADNLGNAVTVLSGPQDIPYAIGALAGQTKPWGIHLAFATPFDYDPTLGRALVIDLNIPGQDASFAIDFVDASRSPTADSAAYRVFNRSHGASSGQLQSYAPVIRFDVALAQLPPVTQPAVGGVPEPGTWALMILGFGAAGASLRARRRLTAAQAA